MAENDHQDIEPNSVQYLIGIHFLPPELLADVFSYLSNNRPLRLRHALLVCHLWYNTIVHNPNLWSTIRIDREFFARFAGSHSARAEAFTRSCLERSSSVPLHIILDELVDPKDIREATIERVALVGQILGVKNIAHIRRCVSFSWTMVKADLETSSLGEALPKELEMLEFLHISDFDVHQNDLVSHFPKCPSLKEVHLVNHIESNGRPYFTNEDFARVEKLTFDNQSAWIEHDISCISRFRSIHTLVLRDLSSASRRTQWYINQDKQLVARLPSLQKLRLVGLIMSRLLCRLDVPALQEVQVEDDELERHSLWEIPRGVLRSVTSLFVIVPSPLELGAGEAHTD